MWMTSLKDKCINSTNPYDSKVLWTAFRKRLIFISSNLQDICAADALENLYESMSFYQLNVPRRQVHFLKNVSDSIVGESSSGENDEAQNVEDQTAEGQIAEDQAAEDQIVEAHNGEDPNANVVVYEAKVATENPSSEQPTAMEIENASSSVAQTLNELNKENEELKSKFDQQDADKQELKVWMVKQEESTAELQRSTADLQKTIAEIKDWMAKQDASSSEIKNLLMTLVSKNSQFLCLNCLSI